MSAKTIKVQISCKACRNCSCEDADCEGFKTAEFPAVFQVCHDCEGHGTVLNPSMRFHAYTQEEFERDFSDDDKQEYFKRGGMYDVTCPTCQGKNVILTVDHESITNGGNEEQKRLLAEYEWSENMAAREAREEAAIRCMDSGGY